MHTFICSAILGIIVSWCLYGKEFSNKLSSVALTVLCVIFGATLIASSISVCVLPTEKVFSEKSKLLPLSYNQFVKDTSIRITTVNKKGTNIKVNKIDTVVNYDSIPQYFIIDKDGDINFFTNDGEDGCKECHGISYLTIVKIDTTSWLGRLKTKYKTEGNNWVTEMSIPYKDSENILYLSNKQYTELTVRINRFNEAHKGGRQLAISK